VGTWLTQDERVPLVSATGSVAMGRRVSENVSNRLGRTILELGGNNAVIVGESADLEQAVPAIVFGAIGTAGQRCTSIRRLIVHESVKESLVARLIKAYSSLAIGDPLDPKTRMGPLIDADAVGKMQMALESARDQGGTILYGGRKRGETFVDPAIVEVPGNVPIVAEETFAPILYVMAYEDFEEALWLHNDVPQGLSSSLFSTDLREAETFLSHKGSDCGIANVNVSTSGAEIGAAFGGEKDTGGGREAGSDAWKAYMRRQSVTINWGAGMPLSQGIDFSY
jgi:aldehyde dehydrogenase (NAD+)